MKLARGGRLAACLFAVALATACASAADPNGSIESPSEAASSPAASGKPPVAPKATQSRALLALGTLAVKGRAAKTGYERDQFGQSWTDVNRNGCDTRTDILDVSLSEIMRTGRCTITGGLLQDPYTGTSIRYVRGGPSEVDVDHVVALSNAWQTGAFAFPFAKRVALANDPLNLLAVAAPANRQKSDGDAATWLPSNKSFRCAYVARQVAVKVKYQLWVTAPEAAAMRSILKACPGEILPAPGSQSTIASNTGGIPEPDAATSAPGSGSATKFATCSAARAARVTPIRRGSPLYEFNSHLDGDSDGVACE